MLETVDNQSAIVFRGKTVSMNEWVSDSDPAF